ncbi:MAG: HAMP domain-containing histidine kinase [Nitrospirae bacterium]|nr:HAMP domain-containing histidine kinase [Nitrospirota bacterium]
MQGEAGEAAVENRCDKEDEFNCIGVLSCKLSHEINNYLTNAILAVQIMNLKIGHLANDPIVLQNINAIEKSLDLASHAASQLLTINKLTKAGFERIDVNALLKSVIRDLAGVLKDIEVYYELSDIPDVKAHCLALKRILINLLINSIESMPEGKGRITLSTSLLGDKVEIGVHDTGCGIAKEDIPKVFDPFYSTKNKTVRLGLGLAVVHELIKQHDGNVELKSKPNKGTRVTITLPVANIR